MTNGHPHPEPPEDRDGFRFRGGSPALDLTATLQARRSTSPRELLATPQDLDRWLVSAGLASAPPGATEADLGLARALREAVFALASSAGAARFDAEACAVLNRIAASPPAAPVLAPDGRTSLHGTVGNRLASLAQEAVRLFGAEADRIRQCEAQTCSIFFVDTSRSGKRRWCSMAACGNKAKVSAHRVRSRSAQGSD